MRIPLVLIMLSLANSALACNSTLLDQNFRKLAESEMVNLCETYAGKVLLVVNTASKCGYTPQYEELEQLYNKYQSKGLVVLGFPSNDFMGQEPGTEAEIQDFCRLTYDVKFPMFEKTTVKKGHAHPFYVQLAELSGTYPTWNFQKYLINRDGQFITQFSPHTKPSDPAVVTAIEQALRQ
ncbi:glutathione peroxidase [Nitrosomonas ureae]|uniref:Glutathione peroxidase n=1 Tax=Nitrosomonas ureae TaxID=44577 RepID=A0A1H5U8L3_9PROT|nr:glutathione peroxidase [Nitrosomonas ureae]SEF71386.1 glutathione peroxidase [Nitrosomonas ureae]